MEEFFRKYYNDALLYTVSLSRNRAIAEDVVSNAFYKALTKPDAEKDEAHFKAWLFTVCRNEYFSICRKRARRNETELDGAVADDSEEVADKIIKDENYRALYRAIELLPDNQRELITLFYFENLAIKEIARIVGKSEGSVKVSLCRARDNLRRLLEGAI